jgi:uncharacterized protein (TIGR03492 family)
VKVLFVSNGHGEVAIADRIARELRTIAPEIEPEHLSLVGNVAANSARQVGPRKAMPSGGLVAMLNLANFARDLRAGLFQLTIAQRKFLRAARGRYAVVVAVGDAFALFMALQARTPTVFVGTAKSAFVADYGPLERRVLRRARAVFVRDEATAARLRSRGVIAEAPGNVIVDLFTSAERLPEAAVAGFDEVVALLPGSRSHAYDDAAFLTSVIADVARERTGVGAILSLAPGIDPMQMADALRTAGFGVRNGTQEIPFEIERDGRVVGRAWSGAVGAALREATLVLGQAGTANEAAAAGGLPVVAFDRGVDREHRWYRRRQRRLLGDALTVLRDDRPSAARHVAELLHDRQRRTRLGAIGASRMGRAGGAARIARHIAELANHET